MKKLLFILIVLLSFVSFGYEKLDIQLCEEDKIAMSNKFAKYEFVWNGPTLADEWENYCIQQRLNATTNLIVIYKNFNGNVYVNFEVKGFGLSPTMKQYLEEEISKAIQNILNTHFPNL